MAADWDLSPEQTEQARDWAAKLGVPESEVIADAQAAKYEGYAGAYRAAQGTIDRMAGASMDTTPGGGPLATAECAPAIEYEPDEAG